MFSLSLRHYSEQIETLMRAAMDRDGKEAPDGVQLILREQQKLLNEMRMDRKQAMHALREVRRSGGGFMG